MRTHYENLYVAEDATDKEIKRAFRALAQKWHPDKHPNKKLAERNFNIIRRAYDVLSCPEKRAEHDAYIKENRRNKESRKESYERSSSYSYQSRYGEYSSHDKYKPADDSPDNAEAKYSGIIKIMFFPVGLFVFFFAFEHFLKGGNLTKEMLEYAQDNPTVTALFIGFQIIYSFATYAAYKEGLKHGKED